MNDQPSRGKRHEFPPDDPNKWTHSPQLMRLAYAHPRWAHAFFIGCFALLALSFVVPMVSGMWNRSRLNAKIEDPQFIVAHPDEAADWSVSHLCKYLAVRLAVKCRSGLNNVHWLEFSDLDRVHVSREKTTAAALSLANFIINDKLDPPDRTAFIWGLYVLSGRVDQPGLERVRLFLVEGKKNEGE